MIGSVAILLSSLVWSLLLALILLLIQGQRRPAYSHGIQLSPLHSGS